MNEQSPESPEQRPIDGEPVNASRRRLGKLGVTGTAVVLSVPSRSAVAGWGMCTGSELASGNLSRAATANPCGCSPGFWWNKNGVPLWQIAGNWKTKPYGSDGITVALPGIKFNKIFGVNFFAPDVTLSICGPSSKNPLAPKFAAVADNTAMHAIAALLNAAYYGTRYPVGGLQTPASVIAAFQTACSSMSPKDTLSAFVAKVDVYSSSNTWCNGSDHGGTV